MKLFDHAQETITNDDQYTPPWVFDAMGLRFDLDVAAPPGGVPWIPCDRYYTQEDDALIQPWEGRIWMNPPYSEPRPFVERFIEHGDGVSLIPTSNGEWFISLLDEATYVTAVRKPIRFIRPDGHPHPSGSSPLRTFFVAIGAGYEEAMHKLAVFAGGVVLRREL